MKLIIGLGNPGPDYERTRHNAGFMQVDSLAEHMNASWEQDKKKKAFASRGTIAGESVICIKPQTFMNLSGEAAALFMNYYKLTPLDVIVIHDEVDLSIGTIRLKKNGGDGGHRGVASVHQHLGSAEFVRIRIGVGRAEWFADGETHKSYSDASGFVLGRFNAEETRLLSEVTRQVGEAVHLLIEKGIAPAMNEYNRVRVVDPPIQN